MCGSHFLGVVQQRVVKIFRQYDGGGKYGAGQRSASGFVASCLNEFFVEKIL